MYFDHHNNSFIIRMSIKRMLGKGLATYWTVSGVYVSYDLYKMYPQHKLANAAFGISLGPIICCYSGTKSILWNSSKSSTMISYQSEITLANRAVFSYIHDKKCNKCDK
jgi:hypothetical protein